LPKETHVALDLDGLIQDLHGTWVSPGQEIAGSSLGYNGRVAAKSLEEPLKLREVVIAAADLRGGLSQDEVRVSL
jgi:hypothetical protein